MSPHRFLQYQSCLADKFSGENQSLQMPLMRILRWLTKWSFDAKKLVTLHFLKSFLSINYTPVMWTSCFLYLLTAFMKKKSNSFHSRKLRFISGVHSLSELCIQKEICANNIKNYKPIWHQIQIRKPSEVPVTANP